MARNRTHDSLVACAPCLLRNKHTGLRALEVVIIRAATTPSIKSGCSADCGGGGCGGGGGAGCGGDCGGEGR